MLLVAAFWYFVVIGAFSVAQHFLEQRTAER
jgi:ABC-type amino acid transport system permease subunit